MAGTANGFMDTTASNAGMALRMDDVDIEACTDMGGGYNIGWVDTGEWLQYSVTVMATGMYRFELRIAAKDKASQMHLELNGNNISGSIDIPMTGGWQTWQSVTTKAIPLAAGNHMLRVVFDSDLFNLNYIQVSTANDTPMALMAPSQLVATVNNDTSMLSWADTNTQETGFELERQQGNNTWGLLATLGANATSYQDKGLAADTAYQYRLRALRNTEKSDYSNTASVRTAKPAPQPLLAPTNAMATWNTDKAQLSWTAAKDALQYRVERKKATETIWMLLNTITDTTLSDAAVERDITYHYRIIALAGDRVSPPSTTVEIKVPAAPVVGLDGGKLYAQQCANCHGADGSGGSFKKPLNNQCTVCGNLTTLTSVIDKTMPLGNPNACDAKCSEAISSYIITNFVTTTTPTPPPPPTTTPPPTPTACSDLQPAPRSLRLLTRREYANTVRDLLSYTGTLTQDFPVEPQVRGYDNNAKVSIVTSRHVDEYLSAAEQLAQFAISQRKAPGQCTAGTALDACAKSFIPAFGRMAFRRPLTGDEITTYTAFFAADLSGNSIDMAMQLTIKAMLSSPNFLYRSEVGNASGTGFKLDAYETASSLAYTLWGSMPDSALLDAAAQGKLGTAAAIKQYAEQMLLNNKAREQLGVFARQWLGAEGVLSANKDLAIYPNFTAAVREAMAGELTAFVDYVAFDSNGNYNDLFTRNDLFVNNVLATFYGIAGTYNNTLTRVPNARAERAGLLTLGAVMASHAHSNESSPIKRGKFVRDRLLCHDLAPPPPDLDTTPPGLDPKLTTRERFAKHTANASCAACHQYIDGVGFGFERFDGVGAYRERENNLPVNDAGNLVGLETLTDGYKMDFSGPQGLAHMIVASKAGPACLTRHYFRFSYGLEENKADECAIQTLAKQFSDSGNAIKSLLLSLVSQESFTLRRAAQE
jgi:hypothetical protein